MKPGISASPGLKWNLLNSSPRRRAIWTWLRWCASLEIGYTISDIKPVVGTAAVNVTRYKPPAMRRAIARIRRSRATLEIGNAIGYIEAVVTIAVIGITDDILTAAYNLTGIANAILIRILLKRIVIMGAVVTNVAYRIVIDI